MWTLEKAVYGFRESPFLWSQERDARLEELRWKVGTTQYRLSRCASDSQVWKLLEVQAGKILILGVLVVCVDGFLLQTGDGPLRNAFLAALANVWTLAKEESLTTTNPITFLGIELVARANGDVFLHQQGFVKTILQKHEKSTAKGLPSVQIDKLPTEPDPPTPADLKALQQFFG